MTKRPRKSILPVRLLCPLAMLGWLAAGILDLSAASVRKPEKTVLLPGHETNRIAVKFRDGLNVRLRNIEYSYNSNHLDLPAIINLTPDAIDPFNDDNHGTATLGEMSALENGWGTTAIAYDATFYFAGANYASGYNVGSGITTAASQLREGDLLLIEQSVWGPNSTQDVMDTGGEFGTVPVEWFEPYYNDIVMAAGLLCSCASPAPRTAPIYPAHWWTPVPKEGAPAWEILPQEAKPGEVILSKRNELGLLSNFAPTPFVFHGRTYASVEGFWQAMKYPENAEDPRATFPGLTWAYTRAQVEQMTSFTAKRAGDLANTNMAAMRITWVTYEGRKMEYRPPQPGEHYRLIVAATWQKVLQNAEVRRVLWSTGNLVLKPDHYQEPDAPAAWRYYEILMDIRGRLQKGNYE